MKTRKEPTCDDCFFRQEGLCALPGHTTCPTFRAASSDALSPPRQPRLIPRPAPRVAVGHAT